MFVIELIKNMINMMSFEPLTLGACVGGIRCGEKASSGRHLSTIVRGELLMAMTIRIRVLKSNDIEIYRCSVIYIEECIDIAVLDDFWMLKINAVD